MKVIMERFNQFNQLYRYDDNFGWTHRYLTIREQGALLALNDLPAVTRETIARYLILQHTSLERQQKLFYCRESFLKQEYKLRLTPTNWKVIVKVSHKSVRCVFWPIVWDSISRLIMIR